VHGEPQRERRAGAKAALALGRRQLARASRIERNAIGIARPAAVPVPLGDERIDLAAALETRIDQTLRLEHGNGCFVIVEMLALPPYRLLPGNDEPGEILVDRRFV